MSAEIILNQTIRQYLLDLKSDKVTTRTKSLENIQRQLDDRPADLKKCFAYCDEDAIKWKDFYHSLHDAVREQCERLDKCTRANIETTKNKNDAYKTVITKCINLANEPVAQIPLRTICDTVLGCFRTATHCKYFASCYLKIAHKHILSTKGNLNELKASDWAGK